MENTQYEYGGEYIMLPLPSEVFAELPETIEHNGHVLHKKSSFHVSLVCTKGMSDSVSEQVKSFFETFTNDAPITFNSFVNDFRFIEKDERKSIVVLCTINNLGEFFSTMKELLDVNIPTQPAHVTLYTLQKDAGIGVASHEEMDLTETVQIPELLELLEELKL